MYESRMMFGEAYAYLLSLPRFAEQGGAAYLPGLDRMEAMMDAMGRPHEAFESIHVAGTNGKGSTASMVAAIGTAAGLRMGLHTSPHLLHPTERLRLDGVPAPASWLAEAVRRFKPVMEDLQPSFFEALTALSFLYFAEKAAEWAVVEVGLGGRLDATNILRPRVAAITAIGLDHTDVLGGTLPEIAREKAGIIKSGVPVVTAIRQPDVLDVLRTVAAERTAPLHHVRDEVRVDEVEARVDGLRLRLRTPCHTYAPLHVGLPGRHQQENAMVAVRTAELAFEAACRDPAPALEGLRDVRRLAGLRGRLDVLQAYPLIVADVGHNPDGLQAALAFMHEALRAQRGRLFVVFGVMRDKDAFVMARLLVEAKAEVFVATLDALRAYPAERLATLLRQAGRPVQGAGSVEEGLAWFRQHGAARDGLLFVGSHHVVAPLYTFFEET